ncbi:MAG: HAMP domain-containing histidine kinase [Clostridium sp.]|nr:HAMP domain-containing histidine kinase [Acetatifactor muris]MCM1527379.1 HAMP domain-containing histidine kinase [Bacteroides sp.]MCM1563557.1 HAMP domain-containing histidine kinase [Clostridium sp.]
MKKGNITESVGFKIVLFFVLAVGSFVGCLFVLLGLVLWDNGGYREGYVAFKTNMMEREAYNHMTYICMDSRNFATLSDMERAFMLESQRNNVTYSIVRVHDGKEYWSNADEAGGESPYVYTYACERPTRYNPTTEKWEEQTYMVYLYVDPDFPKQDTFRYINEWAGFIFQMRFDGLIAAAIGIFLAIISFILLMCSAGHRRGQEGVTPGVLSNIWLDLLTAFFGAGAVGIGALTVIVWQELSNAIGLMIVLSAGLTLEAVWCTIYLREFALRMKMGKWWQHSLLYTLIRALTRAARRAGKALVILIKGIPGIAQVVLVIAALTLGEFLGLLMFRWDYHILVFCWVLEKILIIPPVLYAALAFRKLQKGGRALAEGDLSHKLDTRYLVLDFKEHGEDLNRIGEGISHAVEERLRSERLKTELITNVSHDLKTPLTSIINYADLLGSVAAGDGSGEDQADREARIKEYSEVVLRQSGRLKKLLEDLVDISKASTGNMEVVPTPCELGVLLTQVAGEYETRLAEKNLDLHMAKPEEEVRIMADGRHLWRVFDNLMNNICKYAQEGSRVYLNLERGEDKVEIIFRNMSKYELNISAQELEERFVRGDASRHMEGSGLGLSIAKSLVELQQGTMEILTDGDLFKVILSFSILDF